MRVKLTKFAISDETNAFPPADRDSHIPGREQDDSLSLPIGYWIEGQVEELPCVGRWFVINRELRNGVVTPGLFISSSIIKISGNIYETRNSKYRVELLS